MGFEDLKDDFMVSLDGPSIRFKDGERERSVIDSAITENRTEIENSFKDWTADVKVLPDDRYF